MIQIKKIIVTTTINEPTEALNRFNNMEDWKLIVVGDKKTPHNKFKEYDYLTPEYQDKTYQKLSKLIGWNCIQRRNIGFVEAVRRGADIIATIDDDNIPYENWGQNLLVGKLNKVKTFFCLNSICFDPLSVTNHSNLWHRGFPIQLLYDKNKNISYSLEMVRCDVQADLWNGDGDVDAICRMEHDTQCFFNDYQFPFSAHNFSPFNSQNTFFTKDAIKKYFVFPYIGRMDDIWGAYYLEKLGFNVIYNKPSVFQKRNKHNLSDDFKDELVGYKDTLNLLNNDCKIEEYIPKKSWEAYNEYIRLMEKCDKK